MRGKPGIAWVFVLLLQACVPAQKPAVVVDEAGEALFRQDPRWLGTDGAISNPLDEQRVFWSFDDTFVAATPANSREQSIMVRNSIAIQTGTDPQTAQIRFHWGRRADGSPASFFPEDGDTWYWTGAGIRLPEGPLVVFLFSIRSTPGVGLGFTGDGHALAVITDPDAPVDTWQPKIFKATPSSFDAIPAAALIRNGEHVVGLALRQQGAHAGALVRYRSADLATGDINNPEWWAGKQRGWVAEDELGSDGPEFVIADAGAECSIHWDQRTRSYVHVATYGFGAADIGLRTAPALTGPWSEPEIIYRPPESDLAGVMVYGAMAHPEVSGPGPDDLLVTYATNSFEFDDLFTEHGRNHIYWPRAISVNLREVTAQMR